VRLDAPPYNGRFATAAEARLRVLRLPRRRRALVVANAMDARGRGVRVLTRTACVSAKRENGRWSALLSNGERPQAKAIVNAAGPWVKSVLNGRLAQASSDAVRLSRAAISCCQALRGRARLHPQNDDRPSFS